MPRVSLGLAASLVVSLSSIASGQPTLVVTGTTPGSLSGDGQSVASAIYDASIARYRVCRYTLGTGIEFVAGGYLNEGNIYTNHDGSVMVWASENREGLGGFATDKITPHYLVEGGSIINIGTMDIGNECDSTLNYGHGLSGDGRYIVGACWTARLCGPFRAWIYDTSAGEFEILPFSIDANNRPCGATPAPIWSTPMARSSAATTRTLMEIAVRPPGPRWATRGPSRSSTPWVARPTPFPPTEMSSSAASTPRPCRPSTALRPGRRSAGRGAAQSGSTRTSAVTNPCSPSPAARWKHRCGRPGRRL